MPSYSKLFKIPGASSQKIYDLVSEQLESFLNKASLGSVQVSRNPALKQVQFESKYASGTLICGESELSLQAKLSLMAMPFKSKIDDGIDQWLGKIFPKGKA